MKRALPEFKEAGRYFLEARWLPAGTNFDNWENLTTGDLRLAGKPLGRIEQQKLARGLQTYYRVLGVTIPSPYGLLKMEGPTLTLGSFFEAVHGTQE